MEHSASKQKAPTRAAIQDVVLGVLALVLVLAVLLAFFSGAVWLLGQLESQVAAAIVAALVTATASVAALILSKRFERRARIAQDIRERKTPVYEELLTVLFRAVYDDKSGRTGRRDKQLARTFSELTPKMIVWGSRDVIQAWNAIRQQDWTEIPPERSLSLWSDLMMAIRRDIGNDVDGLRDRDLLALFINDIHRVGGDESD